MFEDVHRRVTAMGVKHFQRAKREYEHPIVVIGAGLGGIQTMLKFKEKGRSNFICLEKLSDFGGHSWIVAANKFTKLQTERGTYHIDYQSPGAECPLLFDDVVYKTWPTRDQLLTMFRASARDHNLYQHTRFNTNAEKVRPFPGSRPGYTVQTTSWKYTAADPTINHLPEEDEDDEGSAEVIVADVVVAFPGNLCLLNKLDFPGEEEFGGYIDYSSFSKFDYTKAKGKEVILYGHGAFTIENVRTLVEHRCKKVTVMCRKRNLCGMKVISWLAAFSEGPLPGNIMLEGFQKMYDLIGFDVWTAHSVKTDAKRSFAHLSQKTIFGVTDIYFLAGYYGLMEVVVDEIKRLTPGMAHTKKGKKIPCEVIVKAVGTKPDFKIDKMLGIKELKGVWTNGDPLRPTVCNAMFVEARNFGSFSSGPAYVALIAAINWFIDYPQDWEIVAPQMPGNKAGAAPAYVPSVAHMGPTFHQFNLIPGLAHELGLLEAMKSWKQRTAHPIKEYLAQCRHEWEGYIQTFKKHGMIDDRPEPPYPYTEEVVNDMLKRTADIWTAYRGGGGK